MEAYLQTKIPTVLEKYHLTIKDSTQTEALQQRLAFYIYNLVFNVCALIATITSIQNPEKRRVKPQYIQGSLNYVKNQCYPSTKQSGGSYHIDGQYFGNNSIQYQNEVSSTTTDQVNFSMNLARNALPSTFHGGDKDMMFEEFTLLVIEKEKGHGVFDKQYLQEIFESFQVTIKPNSLEVVQKILKMHLNCFMYDLKERGRLTLKKLEEVASLKRHSVFL
jgi:hypothetical protein